MSDAQSPGTGVSESHGGDASGASFEALISLLVSVRAANPFYQQKWGSSLELPASFAEFTALYPYTLKSELAADQAARPPFGTNLNYPETAYIRLHQTSGTSGQPLRWLDTPDSWAAMCEDWQEVFQKAGLVAGDRVLFAFSFGPFLGFWLAFEAAQGLGALCIAGGGMSSALRARVLLENRCTVLCCTPTYALHLAEELQRDGRKASETAVRLLVVAGEPGGSVPTVRARLSEAWNGARIFDHHGMTEVGPVTYEHPTRPGSLVVMERSFLAEVVEPETGKPLPEGSAGELVLTTLRRMGMPLIRYRTGDLVRAVRLPDPVTGKNLLVLEGGILGRVDDMVVVRGVNVYPAAVDEIVRSICGTAEYRVTFDTGSALPELSVEVEAADEVVRHLEARFKQVLALRIPTLPARPGSLPRFEMKARRWRRI